VGVKLGSLVRGPFYLVVLYLVVLERSINLVAAFKPTGGRELG